MPQLPSIDAPLPVARSNKGIVNYDPTIEARGNAQLGQAVGGAITHVADELAKKQDLTAMMDAEQQLSQWKMETLFNPEKGVYNKKGKDALGVSEQTLSAFQAKIEQVSGTLKTPEQRARLSVIGKSQYRALENEMGRFEFAQNQQYQKDVATANLATSLEGAVNYRDDPATSSYYINKGAVVTAATGRANGLPPEMIEQQVRDFRSKADLGVIGAIAVDDPYKAMERFAISAPSMTLEDRATANKMLEGPLRKRQANDIATGLWNAGSPGPAGLVTAIKQAESGGDVGAVSPKGALGLMQLMPDTAKETAKELGLPYDQGRLRADPVYNETLGRAHLNKLLKLYDGNQTLAVAAYNAGQGSVNKWIKENGDPRKGEISEEDWTKKIPFKETREYTGKISAAVARQQPASVDYATSLKRANTIADPELRGQVISRLDDFKKAEKAELDATYDIAAQAIYKGDSYYDLPPQSIQALKPEDHEKLKKIEHDRRQGIEPVTDYDKFEGFLKMPTAQLAQLNLERDVRPYLNNKDFSKVTTAWQSANKGDSTPKDLLKKETDILNRYMDLAGIVTGDSMKAKSANNIALQNKFTDALEGRKQSFVMDHKRDPSPTDIEDMAQQLLLDVKLSDVGMFGADSSSLPLWEVPPEQLDRAYIDKGDLTVDKIPPDKRREIVNKLRAEYGQATQAQIIATYAEMLARPGLMRKNAAGGDIGNSLGVKVK